MFLLMLKVCTIIIILHDVIKRNLYLHKDKRENHLWGGAKQICRQLGKFNFYLL